MSDFAYFWKYYHELVIYYLIGVVISGVVFWFVTDGVIKRESAENGEEPEPMKTYFWSWLAASLFWPFVWIISVSYALIHTK